MLEIRNRIHIDKTVNSIQFLEKILPCFAKFVNCVFSIFSTLSSCYCTRTRSEIWTETFKRYIVMNILQYLGKNINNWQCTYLLVQDYAENKYILYSPGYQSESNNHIEMPQKPSAIRQTAFSITTPLHPRYISFPFCLFSKPFHRLSYTTQWPLISD